MVAFPSVITDRLNVFGFLGGSEVNTSTAGGGSGNFGIQDQRAAIVWTKDHIGAFGGDGDDITIFGVAICTKIDEFVFKMMNRALKNDGFCI